MCAWLHCGSFNENVCRYQVGVASEVGVAKVAGKIGTPGGKVAPPRPPPPKLSETQDTWNGGAVSHPVPPPRKNSNAKVTKLHAHAPTIIASVERVCLARHKLPPANSSVLGACCG